MKIVKVPRVNALGLKGPEDAPDKIIEILKGNDFEIDEIVVDNSNVEESHKQIYENSKKILSKNKRVVFIGGDHSISAPILKGFGEINGFENSFLIMFDAHADCMEPMQEPTHEELFRSAVEYGFRPENVVLIGVRKIEPEEKRFLEENRVNVFLNVKNAWEYIKQHSGKEIYVSVDIDVFDPVIAPGVNCPEKNGLSKKDLFYLFKKILPMAKSMDVVEVVPEKDRLNKTIKIAGEIVGEFLKNEE